MSLAVLPSSPATYGPPSISSLLPPGPSPSKRPKLTLNTSSAPSYFGKGSTSLRLDNLSASSPTTKNTFRNAYYAARSPTAKPPKPSLKPLSTNIPLPSAPPSTRPSHIVELSEPTETSESASASTTSLTSASTIDSLNFEPPYKLPFNASSILKNGPIPKPWSRSTTFSQTKPMFPLPKRVVFRAPLTEEIKTTKYTMKHSDIQSSTSTISTLELPPPVVSKGEDKSSNEHTPPVETDKKNADVLSLQTGVKRDSSDEEEDDNDSVPETPVAGRRKRHRQWRWTLGPMQSTTSETQGQSDTTEEGHPRREDKLATTRRQ